MVAHGYCDPELTRQAFLPDGFFCAGDRGHLRPDGHVVLTERTKDMIIPEQLEVIGAMPRNPTLKILKHLLIERFSASDWTPER
jgi:long-subunit acyl-CoA synthetase (AMP-forming)